MCRRIIPWLGLMPLLFFGVRAQGVPVAVAPETSVDVGLIPAASAPLVQDFILRNEGTAPLEIGQVEKVCDCTSFEIGARTVPPGGETTVTVTVDPRGKRGRFAEGIRIETNDPLKSWVSFLIIGEAYDPIEIEPNPLDFGLLPAGALPAAQFGLQVAVHDPTIEGLADAIPSSDILTCRIEPDGDKRYQVPIVLHPGPPDALVDAAVTLTFAGATPQKIVVPVRGLICSDIEPSRRFLRLAEFLQRSPMSQTVYLTSTHSFQIVKIDGPDWLTTTSTRLPETAGRPGSCIQKVIFSLDPGHLPAEIPPTPIRVTTDLPKSPYVLLTVFDDRQRVPPR
jgi:hypothetical protein